jgi:valyl-tRNA synthetase
MIMAGYAFRGERPFRTVYLTGLVRDAQRRKMSKSLGNSPDALKLIETYGADGVRVGLLLSAAAGNDLLFDEGLCQQGKNFANKIWNAFRLVQGWEVADTDQQQTAALGIKWYQNRLAKTLEEIEDHYTKYRISDALMATYRLIWDDFCSWLLEIAKPAYGSPVDRNTYEAVIGLFEENLKLLHPFMPFLTEEVWQHIRTRTPEQALIVAPWPKATGYDAAVLEGFDTAREVVSGIRTIRKDKNIPFRDAVSLSVRDESGLDRQWDPIISKLSNAPEITYSKEAPESALSFRVGSNEYFIPLAGSVDLEAEIQKLREELEYTRGFLASVEKKLSNERFVNNAPEQVVALERKKAADAVSKILRRRPGRQR